MVNKFLVNFILIGFISIAVFGFLAMGHDAASRGACLAMTFNRSACPAGVFEMISFYSNAFKNFSLATISLGLNLAILAATLMLALFAAFFSPVASYASPILRRVEFLAPLVSRQDFIRWLSLHENSPSFL